MMQQSTRRAQGADKIRVQKEECTCCQDDALRRQGKGTAVSERRFGLCPATALRGLASACKPLTP